MYIKQTLDIVDRVGRTPDKLIEVLLEIQAATEGQYISEDHLKVVSEVMDVPLSKAYGVASFYSMLSTKKRGRYAVQICNSGPCYISKAKTIVKAFEDYLGIKVGEITRDGLFSLEYTSCIGACDIAPAVKINEQVFGNLDREKVHDIVRKIREGEE